MKNKKQIRSGFRESVFKRDGNKCRVCGEKNDPSAHHILDRSDVPNGGYVLENGITLCPDCHILAEYEHNGLEPLPGYSREELYCLIGSSFDLAWEASLKLGEE